MSCDYLLDKDINGIDCNEQIAKGVKSRAVIVNRADIDLENIEFDASGRTIVNMPLAQGEKGFVITQPDKSPFNGTQTEMQEGTYFNTFTNTLSLVMLNHGRQTAQQVDELVNGDYVVILENNAVVSGDPAWQIFGLQGGLKGASAVRELYSDDTLAGWVVTLTETGATKSAIFVEGSVVESLLESKPT